MLARQGQPNGSSINPTRCNEHWLSNDFKRHLFRFVADVVDDCLKIDHCSPQGSGASIHSGLASSFTIFVNFGIGKTCDVCLLWSSSLSEFIRNQNFGFIQLYNTISHSFRIVNKSKAAIAEQRWIAILKCILEQNKWRKYNEIN